jgi:hypothetical protein
VVASIAACTAIAIFGTPTKKVETLALAVVFSTIPFMMIALWNMQQRDKIQELPPTAVNAPVVEPLAGEHPDKAEATAIILKYIIGTYSE